MKKSLFAICISFLILSGCKTTPSVTPIISTQPLTASAISAESGLISIQNIDKLEQVKHLGKGIVHDYALSPDGKKLAVYTCTGLYLYDTETWQETVFQMFDEERIEGLYNIYHTGAVAFSPDGTKIALSNRYADSPVDILDLATGELIKRIYNIPNGHRVTEIEFAPNGETLIIRSNYRHSMPCEGPEDNLALHDISSQDIEWDKNIIFEVDKCSVYPPIEFRFVGNYELFLYKGSMSPQYSVYIVDTQTGQIKQQGNYEMQPDDTSFYISTHGAEIPLTYPYNYEKIMGLFNPKTDGRLQDFGGYKVKLLDGNTRFLVYGYTEKQWRLWNKGKITCELDIGQNSLPLWKFSADKNTFVTHDSQGKISIWNTSDCTQIKELVFNKRLIAYNLMTTLSADGKILVINSGAYLHFWYLDFAQLREVPITIRRDQIFSDDIEIEMLTFVSDSHVIAMKTSRNIFFFDIDSQSLTDNETSDYQVEFSQAQHHSSLDGKLHLSVIKNELRFWDKDGILVRELSPDFQFYDALFSQNGQSLIFIRKDGMLSIWDVEG